MTVIAWAWHRFRPHVGWLPLFLLAAAVACAVTAVLAVEWVRDDDVIVPAAALGLLMGVGLAQRPLRAWVAWLFISLYGLLWTTLAVGDFWPPWAVLWAGWRELRLFWLGQGAIFLDRMGGWLRAVAGGNSSEETIAFLFGLGLLTWLLTAYVGWSAWRQKRPLLGLSLLGVAVAVNSYFGAEAIGWTAAFMAVAGLATGVIHYVHLEEQWEEGKVDYSPEIRTDLTVYATVISIALLLLALLLPAFSITRLSRLFMQQPAVQQAEQALTQAFAGVRQPSQIGVAAGGSDGRGVLPRSYLLGDAPELYETVVMTAVVTTTLPANVTHWRALSYDVYTGRGWAISEERQEEFAAGADIPLPTTAGQTQFEQSVHWLLDTRVIRYSLGQPRQFDQNVVTFWRGLNDLVRVQSGGDTTYHVVSQATTASAEQLQTAVGEIPAVIQIRYTQLPTDLPPRIAELAAEVVGDAPTAYEQALALEQFLRQYTYSLTIEPPPRSADPVEYFLFEQQAGYCDYYASAMTVMARTLGLPARMAAGYVVQPPDEAGVQTIRQINGHSWTEIYFPDYGWVEFEPTATFISPQGTAAEPDGHVIRDNNAPPEVAAPPIPEPDIPLPWGRIALVVGLGLLLLTWWWRQRETAAATGVVWAFGRLQQQAHRLGQPLAASQTPGEFAHTLQMRLAQFGRYERLRKLVSEVQGPIHELTRLFNGRRYGQQGSNDEVAVRLWRGLQRPLWWLRLIKFFTRMP